VRLTFGGRRETARGPAIGEWLGEWLGVAELLLLFIWRNGVGLNRALNLLAAFNALVWMLFSVARRFFRDAPKGIGFIAILGNFEVSFLCDFNALSVGFIPYTTHGKRN